MAKNRRVMVRMAEVRFTPIFKCECCGVEEQGIRFTRQFWHSFPYLDEIEVPVHTLPVGWSAYGHIQYCPDCTDDESIKKG
jgi:hypothetical protein